MTRLGLRVSVSSSRCRRRFWMRSCMDSAALEWSSPRSSSAREPSWPRNTSHRYDLHTARGKGHHIERPEDSLLLVEDLPHCRAGFLLHIRGVEGGAAVGQELVEVRLGGEPIVTALGVQEVAGVPECL